MMEACLAAGTHYLDITGEIDVIEAAAAMHDRAARAAVRLIPAVGFDVVPSDCLAAMLHQQLPTASRLQLGFTASMRISPGTACTALEVFGRGGRVRRDGRIVRTPVAAKSLEIPFREGRSPAVLVPWGDVASAYYTTGIGNIETYMAMPAQQIEQLRRAGPLLSLAGRWPIRPLAEPHDPAQSCPAPASKIARRCADRSGPGCPTMPATPPRPRWKRPSPIRRPS